MPASWFPHLVSDAWVHATPSGHYGSAYGEVGPDGYTFTLHSTTLGMWNVILTGLRADPVGVQIQSEPIEFEQEIPPQI